MTTPLITPNLCWCCGTDLHVLGVRFCPECEVEFLRTLAAKPPVEGRDFQEMNLAGAAS